MANRYWVGGSDNWDDSSNHTIDSCTGGWDGSDWGLPLGQSFASGNGGQLVACQWYIAKSTGSGGTVWVELYAADGSKLPTGSALATSDSLSLDSLSTTNAWVQFNFTSSNVYNLSASTDYCLVIKSSGSSGNGFVARDKVSHSTPYSYPGSRFTGGNWVNSAVGPTYWRFLFFAFTGKWATTSGGSDNAAVPTSSDDVFFDANSGANTVTVSSGNGGCNSLTCTGFTGTLAGTVALTISGSLTLVAGMTYSYTGDLTFNATSSQTLTSASKSLSNLTFSGSGGTWTLQDALTVSSGKSITLTQGTFAANNFAVTTPSFSSSNSNTRTISMGSGTWTLNGTGTVWDVSTATNLTVTASTSTIKLTDASSTAKTFAGGGKTYNNIWITGAGTGTYTISGSNTFADFKVDTPPHTVNFTAGTTQTVTTFTVSGTAGNLITLQSTSGGSAWTLSKASGTIERDYLSIQDGAGTGGAGFYAGTHSTNTSGNTGWVFDDFTPANAYADDATYFSMYGDTGAVKIYLSGDGGSTYTSALSTTFTGMEGTNTYGNGSTELWGRTWTGDDVDDTSFRVKISCGTQTFTRTFKTFGFAPSASVILTGVEVAINGKWTSATGLMSIDHIKVKIYYGTSVVPIQAGSQAFASNGRKNGEGAGSGTGVIVFYDGSNWIACDTGATVVA